MIPIVVLQALVDMDARQMTLSIMVITVTGHLTLNHGRHFRFLVREIPGRYEK